MKYILIVYIILINSVFAGSNTIPLPKDSRVRVIAYDKNDVVQLMAHYNYNLTIEYHPQEVILDIYLGDKVAWSALPIGNRLTIKPKIEKTTTNMTVLTSFRSYLYELKSRTTNNPRDKQLTFYLRYEYPEDENRLAMMRYQKRSTKKNKAQALENNQKVTATNLYFGYRFQGNTAIAPIQVFDDGQFTYFKFREKSPLPAIFSVDEDRNESIINYRVENAYIVVEQLSDRFTLRHGSKQVVTVIRDNLPGFEPSNKETNKNGIPETKHANKKSMEGNYADW